MADKRDAKVEENSTAIFGKMKEIVVHSDPTQDDDKAKSKDDEVGEKIQGSSLSDDAGNIRLEMVIDSGEVDPTQHDKAKVHEVGETLGLTSNDDESEHESHVRLTTTRKNSRLMRSVKKSKVQASLMIDAGKEKWKGEDGDNADDDNEPGPKFPFPQLRNRLEMGYYVFDVPERSITMATNGMNLECRMYEAKYPEVDHVVMIQVKSMEDSGAYVSLLEYNNIEGMILFSELSRISSLIKVGRIEPVRVLRVDKEKGYIDLSKRLVSEDDIRGCEEKFNKSTLVHTILLHVAETLKLDLEMSLVISSYIHVGWPLYRKYGHAFEAFKLIVTDPDTVLDFLTRQVKEICPPDGQEVTKLVPAITNEMKESLVENIKRRMTLQPLIDSK
ncbi:hypothetical protein CASFOL_006835 [Castilleja foliolosa]|uniref:S1 motif domain-containing protein n=1 Tax=Castilleja foliolosa TaxID=1961234 RepID=A0ABD3E8D0_9LAMI